MSKLKYIFTVLFLLSFAGIIAAQDIEDEPPPPEKQKKERPNLLRELDLTREQVQQIREINQASRQELRDAQQKIGEARRNLDQAIYAEKADDADVRIKLREFQDAQSEAARLRADIEYQIRKVLTPEQLVRFREIRQNFEQFKNNRERKRNPFRMRNQLRNKRLNKRQLPPQN
jgi:Spy/CpxP family protein refolding chaperone